MFKKRYKRIKIHRDVSLVFSPSRSEITTSDCSLKLQSDRHVEINTDPSTAARMNRMKNESASLVSRLWTMVKARAALARWAQRDFNFRAWSDEKWREIRGKRRKAILRAAAWSSKNSSENADVPCKLGLCRGIRGKFPGIGSSTARLYVRGTHVRSRWKNLFGSNGAAGNVWGNNEGKRAFRLSSSCWRGSSYAPVSVPVSPSPSRSLGWYHYFTVGWLPKIRDEGGSGHRQRESLR